MIKDYRPSERVTKVEYYIEFSREDTSGYSFPCTKGGELIHDEHFSSWYRNYLWCMEHLEEFEVANVVRERRWTYRENPSGVCHCGHRIDLFNQYLGACECPHCGQWWNTSGQELVPPSHWNDYGEMDYEY